MSSHEPLAGEALEKTAQLIADLTDPDDCWFDHHGGCQTHGYLSLEQGQLCPHAEAKQWTANYNAVKETQ